MELIEKLKKVSTGLCRLGQIAEQNSINEAIALLEKPRVSAEEIEQKAIETIEYWKERCLLAEKCLGSSPLYTDINTYQAFLNR